MGNRQLKSRQSLSSGILTTVRSLGSDSNTPCPVLLQGMNPDGEPERSWILGSNKAVMISCGLKHILVVLEDGNLYTYGNNQYGQRAYYPSRILNYLSDIPEMNVVYITDRSPIHKISCGAWHCAAVLDSGALFTWGLGDAGQLGYPLNEKNSIDYKGRKYQNVPKQIEIEDEHIEDVACGSNFTLILTRSEKVYACGNNQYGVLGVGVCNNSTSFVKVKNFEREKIIKIAAGWSHCLALTRTGKVYMWGHPYHEISNLHPAILEPRLVTELESLSVVDISCGDYHSAALSEGNIYTWGGNGYGQLGFNTSEYPDPFLVESATMVPGLRTWVEHVSCGGCFTAVLYKDGTVQGWGSNKYKQLHPSDKRAKWQHCWMINPSEGRVRSISCGNSTALMLVDTKPPSLERDFEAIEDGAKARNPKQLSPYILVSPFTGNES